MARFSKKNLLNTKCVFWFSLHLLSETFLILRRTERDTITNVQGGSNMTGTDLCVNKCKQSRSYLNHPVYRSSCKVTLFLSDFKETWIFSTDFRKILKYQINSMWVLRFSLRWLWLLQSCLWRRVATHTYTDTSGETCCGQLQWRRLADSTRQVVLWVSRTRAVISPDLQWHSATWQQTCTRPTCYI
jgi:hypothetical protein